MALTEISSTNAFSIGADLWIFADPEDCGWSRLADWYSQFIVWRSHNRLAAQTAPELQATLAEMEWKPQWPKQGAKAPLLLSSAKNLACRHTVVISEPKAKQDWIETAYKIWVDLGKGKLRVFLPPFITAEDILELWPSQGPADEIAFVTAGLAKQF